MESLGLDAAIVALLRVQGIVEPTPIQSLAIPRILRGESVVVRSQTGSGKTLAYVAPMVQLLLRKDGVNGDQSKMLVVLPTRELAQQVGRVMETLIGHLEGDLKGDLEVATIYGGVEYEAQREALSSHSRVIIATPGRLLDLIGQGVVDLSELQYFILDEVDQMVDMGFREPIVELSKYRAEGAQTLCFSATLSDLIAEVVGDIAVIEDSAAPLAAQRIVQRAYFVEQSMMEHLLLHLLRQSGSERSILFCRSRKMADRLGEVLRGGGFAAEVIHSDRSQAAREHIMRRFSEGETTVLVATDLIARGIDVDGVTHVFNFGLPQTPDQYIHRIGRTGRAGSSGEAHTLLCADEQESLKRLCATMRQRVEVIANHPYITPSVTQALTLSTATSQSRSTSRKKRSKR